jgi:LEA14-like dessication related protein
LRERVRFGILAGLVAILAGAACAGAFQQPEVRFYGLRLGGLGIRGGTVYAQLNVANPNRFGLETTALTYDLELRNDENGQGTWSRLASGTFAEPIRVAARDSAVVEIPIEFAYADMGAAFRSIMDRGTFDYRVSGVVSVRDPIRRDVPYRRTGTVSLDGMR